MCIPNPKSISYSRIAIFDDSLESYNRFSKLFSAFKVKIKAFFRPEITDKIYKELELFNPDLIVVDLMMGESKLEGYRIIRKLSENKTLRNVSIVIWSKFITDSHFGSKEKERCLSFPGVVAVYGKYPGPSAKEFLRHVQKT